MIIVLCGVRGSGKDTIGDILRDRHDFKKEAFANPMKEMVKHAFPAFTDEDLYGPSKNRENQYEQYPLTGCPWCSGGIIYDKYDNRDGAVDTLMPKYDDHRRCSLEPDHDWLPKFLSPRIALQSLGTQWGRQLYNNVWIDAAFERIARADYEARRKVGLEYKPDYVTSWVITDGRFLNEVRRSKELGGITVKLTRGLKDSKDTHPSEAEFRTIPDHEFSVILDNANISLEELPGAVQGLLDTIQKRFP